MWEGYFHTIIYLITSFLKLNVQSEIMKHKGRLDLVVQIKKFLYIMEFKLASSSKNAIKQIKQRDYALSYKNSRKTIYLLGINFNKKERNVKDWQTEIWT